MLCVFSEEGGIHFSLCVCVLRVFLGAGQGEPTVLGCAMLIVQRGTCFEIDFFGCSADS